MDKTIESRELFVLDGAGACIQGTYHRPPQAGAHDESDDRCQRLGILFLNSLSLPRAATGDSAVRWADAIAGNGYPAFRIDLPGLGDSAGEASTDLLEIINSGGLAAAAAAAVRELVARFALTGVVIFGHCAGSVSALYTAGIAGGCKGLILLDTYFHLPQVKRSEFRERLSGWARRSRMGGVLSNAYDRAKKFLLLMRGSSLPGNANFELLGRWKQVTTAGLPILLLQAPGIKAQGSKPRVGEFDYIDYVVKLAGRKNQVTVRFVESADHSFANREGHLAVQQLIEGWLHSNFPLEDLNQTAIGRTPAAGGEIQNPSKRTSAPSADMGCVLEGR